MSDVLQLAIILFIILGIGVAVWRGGQANPEGTGRLGRRLGKVEQALSGKATTEDVGEVQNEIASLNNKIARLEAEQAADRRVNQLTYEAVRRLEDYFLKKGTGV
ncbi:MULTISPECIES: hypothetical protein [unclassified Sphingopyxis]|uniref:hypothetical protein n=1 Tax=unclassified Sphingopyxis TaxID=2614943 RepID=UPI0007316DD0|nr:MULTISPECIES: hypothetical protein [unclassified Sphingopyxis]KTE24446.1 hypothetical protein ATE61_13650 [Sphingopyxis sp. H057]KTE50974.1 hypothetical protein ATE69_17350 [Sphingopyxis sp. H071]KTE52117.1 hypothetical protein ATE64_11955 [Sphingopyxis sp. H073]KTE60550.1 hypothetical protein ATE66_08190 [Sphingopyxis sp. H107]KTE63861.1 hypothetical protein ATE65_13745 [Sphingopyxis sp. H100]